MPTASELEEEAMQWLVRLDGLDAVDAPSAQRVRADFDRWCAGDARRQAAYLRLAAAWRKADQLGHLASLDGKVDENLLAPQQPSSSNRWPWALAAVLGAVAIGVTWFFSTHSSERIYTTAIGGFERLLLEDGSTLELDTDSQVRVQFSGERRQLKLLRGQAYFKVAREAQRPFEVTVGETTVRALGTAFSVRLREAQKIEVKVTEGRVAILDPALPADALPTALSAGEAVVVQLTRVSVKMVKLESPDFARHLSWTQGRLSFDGETLREAVAEFNRYNPRQLVIADPSIAQRRIGGSFQTTDPQSFVTALERSFGVSVQAADAKQIRLVSARK